MFRCCNRMCTILMGGKLPLQKSEVVQGLFIHLMFSIFEAVKQLKVSQGYSENIDLVHGTCFPSLFQGIRKGTPNTLTMAE